MNDKKFNTVDEVNIFFDRLMSERERKYQQDMLELQVDYRVDLKMLTTQRRQALAQFEQTQEAQLDETT